MSYARRQQEDAIQTAEDVREAFSGTVNVFKNILGRTMVSVTGKQGDEDMVFTATDGSTFRFYHSQDCCESVYIQTIDGDLSDLVGVPIYQAEEVSSGNEPYPDVAYTPESFTWTFYKFATHKGAVTVRWLGTSNGYYSERVAYEEKIK